MGSDPHRYTLALEEARRSSDQLGGELSGAQKMSRINCRKTTRGRTNGSPYQHGSFTGW